MGCRNFRVNDKSMTEKYWRQSQEWNTNRRLVDEDMEKQAGLVDPRRGILDKAMDNGMIQLHEQIRVLQKENQRLTEENIKLKKAMDRKT